MVAKIQVTETMTLFLSKEEFFEDAYRSVLDEAGFEYDGASSNVGGTIFTVVGVKKSKPSDVFSPDAVNVADILKIYRKQILDGTAAAEDTPPEQTRNFFKKYDDYLTRAQQELKAQKQAGNDKSRALILNRLPQFRPPKSNASNLLTVEEAAKEIGLGEVTLRNYIYTGKADVVRENGRVFLTREEVKRLKNRKRENSFDKKWDRRIQ